MERHDDINSVGCDLSMNLNHIAEVDGINVKMFEMFSFPLVDNWADSHYIKEMSTRRTRRWSGRNMD